MDGFSINVAWEIVSKRVFITSVCVCVCVIPGSDFCRVYKMSCICRGVEGIVTAEGTRLVRGNAAVRNTYKANRG